MHFSHSLRQRVQIDRETGAPKTPKATSLSEAALAYFYATGTVWNEKEVDLDIRTLHGTFLTEGIELFSEQASFKVHEVDSGPSSLIVPAEGAGGVSFNVTITGEKLELLKKADSLEVVGSVLGGKELRLPIGDVDLS